MVDPKLSAEVSQFLIPMPVWGDRSWTWLVQTPRRLA